MTAKAAFTGSIPTVFVGMTDELYSDESWSNDKTQIVNLFGIPEQWIIGDIKITKSETGFVNTSQFAQNVRNLSDVINTHKPSQIRIVGLGFGTTSFVADALSAFIRAWNIPAAQREVQFIVLGDSPESHNLNFCKKLCMEEQCKTLQFYSMHDYDIFGNLSL